ncbi:MAG: hypothetical protein ACPIOQ_11845, partial [Promethearchaeia archaeon]
KTDFTELGQCKQPPHAIKLVFEALLLLLAAARGARCVNPQQYPAHIRGHRSFLLSPRGGSRGQVCLAPHPACCASA